VRGSQVCCGLWDRGGVGMEVMAGTVASARQWHPWAAQALRVTVSGSENAFSRSGTAASRAPGMRSAPVLGTGVEVLRPRASGPAPRLGGGPGTAGAAGAGGLGAGMPGAAFQPRSPRARQASLRGVSEGVCHPWAGVGESVPGAVTSCWCGSEPGQRRWLWLPPLSVSHANHFRAQFLPAQR